VSVVLLSLRLLRLQLQHLTNIIARFAVLPGARALRDDLASDRLDPLDFPCRTGKVRVPQIVQEFLLYLFVSVGR